MVVKAEKRDVEALAELAMLMWEDNSVEELISEFSETVLDGRTQFFLKYEDNTPVGFAQCCLRYDYVEGTSTTPVGYLEGVFVKEEYRRKGYAKELLAECEVWARKKGCMEFASDCEIDNGDSFHFHRAMGFKEANRIICFTKDL
ncbi:MAG: GNAT family N-acetyltransferase [Ruminiclostridium sp.]|nr:GNAT family N-acetyltransferase [Ruminiclostridium sp.]